MSKLVQRRCPSPYLRRSLSRTRPLLVTYSQHVFQLRRSLRLLLVAAFKNLEEIFEWRTRKNRIEKFLGLDIKLLKVALEVHYTLRTTSGGA